MDQVQPGRNSGCHWAQVMSREYQKTPTLHQKTPVLAQNVPKNPPAKMYPPPPPNVPETYIFGGCTGFFWYILGGFSVFGRGFLGTFWRGFWYIPGGFFGIFLLRGGTFQGFFGTFRGVLWHIFWGVLVQLEGFQVHMWGFSVHFVWSEEHSFGTTTAVLRFGV